MLDEQLRVVLCTSALRNLCGLPLVGQPFIDTLIATQDRTAVSAVFERARSRAIGPVDIRVVHAQGEQLWQIELVPFDARERGGLTLHVANVRRYYRAIPVAAGRHYMIHWDPMGPRHGELHSILGGFNQPDPGPGPCFRILYCRESPCSGCPVGAIDPSGTPLSPEPFLVSRRPSDFSLELVVFRRLEEDTQAISTWPIDAPLFARLFRARIKGLAHQAKLTPREQEVLELLAIGRRPKEIAVALNLSRRTIKYHLENLLEKLGAESREDLFRLIS